MVESGRRKKSTPFQIISLIICAAIFVFLLLEVIGLCEYTLGKDNKDKLILYNLANNLMGVVKSNESKITKEESTLKVASVGNIYLTSNIITGAKSGNEYDFTTGFENIIEKLKSYDLVMGSLSTPVGGAELGYSTNKVYNAPDSILKTLNDLNISTVATATYRAMDKNIDGIKNTVGTLKKYNINQTGISDDKEIKPLIVSQKNIKLGILSYATDSNIKITNNNSGYVNILSEEKLKSDIDYLKNEQVDAIIAYLDVPNGDATVITSDQKNNTELLFNNGVDIVFCTGSNVVLEENLDEIEINENEKNEIYVVYSSGDFIGGYKTPIESASIVPTFDITKIVQKNEMGEIISSSFSITHNKPIKLWTEVSNTYSTKTYIMDEEIEKFNLDKSDLTSKQYATMKEQYDRILNLYE